MPESDIELLIGANTKPLEASIKKALKFGETSFGTKMALLRKPEKLKAFPTPMGDPFTPDRSEKAQTGGNGFLKTLKLFKIDLFWRWIKGAWNVLTKYVPFLGAIGDIIGNVIGLILTGLLLPYLPAIMKAMGEFVKWGVDIFNLLSSGKVYEALTKIGEDAGKAVAGALTNINNWIAVGTAIANAIKGVQSFGRGLGQGIAENLDISGRTGIPNWFVGDVLTGPTSIPDIVNHIYIDGKELKNVIRNEIKNSQKGFVQSRPNNQ